jgi:Flp pilus assembly protein TadD
MKKIVPVTIFIICFMTALACRNNAGDNVAQQEKKGQFTEAGSSITEKAVEQDGIKSDLDILIEEGNEAFEARNFDEAITLYTKALSLNPDYADLHYSLGLSYGHKGQLDDAISAFKKAIAIDPNHIKAHNNLGLAYERKVMLDQADSEYRQAIRINPDYAQAHYNIGRIYFLRGAKDPDSRSLAADHYYRAGILFLEQGDEGRALMAYKGLQQTKSKESEQALYNKFSPEMQQRLDNPEK